MADHPGVEVFAPRMTDRDDTTIAILVLGRAVHRGAVDEIGQRQRRALAAAVVSAVVLTKLPGFRRVDAEQADPRFENPDGVAVAHRGGTETGREPCRGKEGQKG